MKWSDVRGALGKLGGGKNPAPGVSAGSGSAADVDALRERLRSGDASARLAAVDALAQLAAGSADQHWTVMEILVGFVRDRAPWLAREESDGPERDVAAVVRALARRRWADTERLPLGLFQVDLRNADFAEAPLRLADFSRAHLENADFTGALLAGANFQEAFLNDAHLMNVAAEDANFLAADLDQANLTGARLERANFREASLKGAQLIGARVDGADFTGADLDAAHVDGSDLSRCVGLTREQLATLHTDARTVLPG